MDSLAGPLGYGIISIRHWMGSARPKPEDEGWRMTTDLFHGLRYKKGPLMEILKSPVGGNSSGPADG